MINRDFEFKLNVSVDNYTSKQQAVDCLSSTGAKRQGKSKMSFKEETLTVDEFINKATNGYTFCNLFEFDTEKKYWIENGNFYTQTYPVYKTGVNKGAMKLSFKSDRFFKGAQVIFVDVDYTHYEEINDYIDALSFKPTCVYCSYSDDVIKGGKISRRFRMVYVFDTIMDAGTFKYVSDKLYQQIVEDTDEEMDDDCGERLSQYMNGVYGNPEVYKTYEIYNFLDICPKNNQDNKTISEVKKASQNEDIEVTDGVLEFNIDRQLIFEMTTLSYDNFMHYNSWKYRYYYRTERTEWIDNTYQFTDENYISLFYNVNTVKDGSERRKKLYERMCLRRVMNPDVTPETILFNAYVDREKYFDNADGVITIDCLIRNVKSAFSMTIDEIKEKYDDVITLSQINKPKFIVNSTIINKKEKIGEVRKTITNAEIGSLYDCNMTVSENLQYFESNGLKIKKSTLYRFVKDNGLEPKKSTKEADLVKSHINKELSIRENLKMFKEMGINTTKYQVEKALKSV